MRLTDWFIPLRVRDDPDRRARYRSAAKGLLGLSATLLFFFAVFLAARATPTAPELALFVTAIAIPLIGALLIRLSGRMLYGLVLINMAAIALVGAWAWLTGGILSAALPWFLANLALLVIFGNRTLLAVAGGAVAVAIILLYAFTIRGFVPYSLVPPGLAHEWTLVSSLSAVVAVVLTAAFMMRERADARARLRAARDEALNASLAKSTFLSSVSHELRTPLSTVIGFAEVLKLDEREPLTPGQAVHVERILNAGDHLIALVNQMIEMSRIVAGDVDLRIENVRVAEVIASSVSMVTLPASKRGITIANDARESAGLLVRADATRLKQVVLNLLSNALKYNRENGSVSIVAAVSQGDHLRISVRDTGKGIPENRAHELFNSFARLGEESGPVQGTGLGLTISKRLIEMMQGSIGYESVEGEGSTFWVELPIAQ